MSHAALAPIPLTQYAAFSKKSIFFASVLEKSNFMA